MKVIYWTLIMVTLTMLVICSGQILPRNSWLQGELHPLSDDLVLDPGIISHFSDIYDEAWNYGLIRSSRNTFLDGTFTVTSVPRAVPVSEKSHLIVVPSDFPSIQEAIDAACPGDTIEVCSGLYRENVVVDKRITLKGVDTGRGPPVIDAGSWVSAVTLDQDCVTLTGFVTSNSSLGSGVEVQSDCNLIVGNTIIGNSLNGLKLVGQRSGNILAGNRITENGFSGVLIEDGAADNFIMDNEITENGFGGLSFVGDASGNLIMGNRIGQNGFVGVQFKDRSWDNYIVGNIVMGNNFGGIDFLGNASCNLIQGNLLLQNNFTGMSLSKNTSCNLIFENYLLNNLEHGASDGGIGNRWDNGTLGNYYSDFECEDKDKDGICDNSCGIYGGSGMDRYPLASLPQDISGYMG